MNVLKTAAKETGVVRYATRPSREYQALQDELTRTLETPRAERESGKVSTLQNTLQRMFCEHFSIPVKESKPAAFEANARVGFGGIMDHETCHRVLGVFDAIVTHPYNLQFTTAEYRKFLKAYQLVCVIEANAWDFYYPGHSGCYILLRFRDKAHRRWKLRDPEMAKRLTLN